MNTKPLLLAVSAAVLVATASLAISASPRQGAPAVPTEHHELLKCTAGKWNAKASMMGMESDGTWVVETVHGGLWNRGEYAGEMMGSPFTGTELLGYDPNKNKYVSAWVDSVTAGLSLLEGEYDAVHDRLVMHGESVGMDGAPTKMTHVLEMSGDDAMKLTMNMAGADGEEMTLMTIEYTRPE